MGAYGAGVAPAAPALVRRRERRFPGWANARNDAAEYARLAVTLGPRLHPVRPPGGRKPRHVRGQLKLWGGSP
jgi:hypothetical protein